MNPCSASRGPLAICLLAALFAVATKTTAGGWRSFYGPGGVSFYEQLARDGDGNVYVGGSINQNSRSQVSIVKYDLNGRRVWTFIYDSEAEVDEFQSFAVTEAGQVYVAANVGTTNRSLVVFKLDPDGTLLWEKAHEGTAVAVAVDSARSVFVAGYIDPEDGLRDSLLIKYRGDGEKQWTRIFDDVEPPISAATDVAVDNAGNVFVAGSKLTVSKFDPEGNSLWKRGYAGQTARKIVVDSDGNAYVTGQNFAAGVLTVKLNPAGDEVWQSAFDQNGPGSVPTEPCDLALGPQGTVYLAVRERVNYGLVKLAADGTLVWNRRESGAANEFSSIAVDGAGDSWLLLTKPASKKKDNVFISGFNADGKRFARARLTNGANGHATAADVLLDSDGNPIVTFRGRSEEVLGWFTTKLTRAQQD